MKPNSSAPLDANFRYSIGNDEVGIDSVSGNPQQLLGFDAQAFLAGTLDLRALIHADDADISALLFAPQATVTRQVANLRLRQANGRIRCVKCSYQKSATTAGVTLDLLLEDAKSLPRTLDDAAAMANFRAMMENTDDYIYFKDRNHVFTGASQTLVKLCEPAEHWTDLIGQTDYDVFPEAYADIYYKLEKQVFAGVEVAHEIQEYLSNEGRKGWVDNRKYPIRNAAGEIIGLYGIARDITGQRKLESDLVAIADFVAQDHGNGFLDALTEFAVRLFAVDYVHVALLEPEGTSVRVVAGRVDGKPVEPGYVYALTGTPCENVLRLDHRCHADHVQALFPDDHDLQDLNAEAYIGEPITDGNGHAIGLIVMVSRQPMADTPATVAGLRILAEQASTALQRQRSEARLRKQRETLQLILDFAPIGIWLQDGKGKLGFVNKAFCQATGIPEERFLGVENYVELIPDEFRPQCLASDAKALASSGVSVTYQRLPFVDGQIHDLQVIKALKRNEAGEPEALIGLSLDVTEQLRQEKLLKASERRLNEAQSIAKVGHWELDIPTGKLHWSDEIYRIFEIEKARFGASYEAFLAAIHPEDREAVHAAFARSLENCLPYGITHRLLMPDGRIKYVREQGETSFRENGQPLYSLGTVQDITELTRVEQELLQERDSTRNILATVEAMIVALDTEGRITLINRKGCQILGYREDELIGQDWFTTCLPRSVDVDQVREVFQLALAGNLSGSEYYENPVRTRSGEERLIAWHNSTIRDKEGNIIGGLSAGEDITERKKNDVKLRESEQLLHAVIDEIPEPVVLKDRNGNFLLCNQAVARLYNTTPEAMVGKHDGDFGVSKEMADAFRDNVMAIMAKGKTEIVFEDSRDAESGEIRHYRSIKRPFKDALGQDQILVVAQDITDIIDAQAKVVISEKRLQEVLAITNEGVWDWHIPSGKVIHNRQWFTLFGAEPGEIDETLEGFVKLIHPDDRDTVQNLITAMLEGNGADYHSKHRLLTLEGRPIWVLDRGRVVERDKNGQAVRVIGSVTDVTYQVEYQQQLEHIAHYDTLTGLPNRVLLADRLHQAVAQALRRGDKLAVAYLDLDGFKAINDQFGHDVGDHLLTTLAGHMKRALREGDTLARMGGDEFVAVLLDLPDVESSVPLVSRLLEAAAEVVIEQGHPLRVSASLGVTFYPQAEAIDADQLLRQADQAMYQAKLAGKNRYHIFDAELDRSVRDHHESLERIKQALDAREFVLYYQPKVNMRTGKVTGAEALIRWRHPERGVLPPGVFLPLIADHPLAIEIGEWVLDTAMQQVEDWKAAGLSLPVSVNIDAIQLEQADFVDRLQQQMAAHPGLWASDLELEVLETSALEDFARVSRVILACSEMGVGFALDDFGTGYSSLTYLKRLPAGMLKIDQSFVRDMLDDPDDLAILNGVLGLSTAFRRQTIAEGVETLAQGEMLLQLGCQLAQGYVIARPMPAEAMPAWLAAWRPDSSWLNQIPISRDDLPILFASVEHRAWLIKVANFVRGEADTPPPLHHEQCRFGQWLKAEVRLSMENRPALVALEPLHIEIHALASELIRMKQEGNVEAAVARLSELNPLRDRLLTMLMEMLQ